MIDFGLSALDDLQKAQDEGIPVPILHPETREPIFTVTVCGPDSEAASRAAERDSEELLARGAVNPLTRGEQYERSTRYMSRCCTAWTLKDKAGENVPFSEDAVYELLSRYKLVRAEVDAVVGNRARFTKRSQTA